MESVKVIVDAYLQRNDHNIIILDWTEDAAGSYLLSAIKKMRQVCHQKQKSNKLMRYKITFQPTFSWAPL